MYSPDERHSIRSEMNRDAMPSPEDRRKNATCDQCGHEDFEDLKLVARRYINNCPATQSPDPDPIELCSECRDNHNPEQDAKERLRERDGVFVWYECGTARKAEEPEPDTIEVEEQVGWTDDGEPITEMVEMTLPDQNPSPVIATECECGAAIDEVFY